MTDRVLVAVVCLGVLAAVPVEAQGIRRLTVVGDAPIQVTTRLGYTTTVVLPRGDSVSHVVVARAGSLDASFAENTVHVRALETDVVSGLTVVCSGGRVWVLRVTESADEDPDEVVYVEVGRVPARAASSSAPAAIAQEPAASLAVGLVLGFTGDCPAPIGCSSAYVSGLGGEGAFYISENIAVVGGLDWGFFRLNSSRGPANWGGHVVGFGGGVRAYGPRGRARVFGEVLAWYFRGAVSDSWQRASLSELSILPGGGIDIALDERVAVRFSGGVERGGWDAERSLTLAAGVAFVFDVGSR